MSWDEYSGAFTGGGNLRDVCVQDTTADDWRKLQWLLVGGDYTLKFFRDDTEEPVPSDFGALVEDPDVGRLLQIEIGGVTLYCHFFSEDTVELDLLAREVRSEQSLDAVLDFIMDLGNTLEKPVILTPENRADTPLLRYAPGDASITAGL